VIECFELFGKQGKENMMMNWQRLERRLREALRDIYTNGEMREGLVKLDEIIASETRRGNVFSVNESKNLCLSPERYDAIGKQEWSIVKRPF